MCLTWFCAWIWYVLGMFLFRALLQVVEMYSSGGDLHLELPTGQQGGTGKLWVSSSSQGFVSSLILMWRWAIIAVRVESLSHLLPLSLQEIPPFETKGVMRASFSSRDVDNHTAFIRIKTNAPNEDQFIILPVEVEVTSGVLPTPVNTFSSILDILFILSGKYFSFFSAAPGIYSSTEMLDFGTLRSQGMDSYKRSSILKFFFSNLSLGFIVHSPSALLCLTDRPKLLNLHLLNSGTKDVPITVRILTGLLNP